MGSELKRRLDYTDYVAAPDDGNCYQIVNGDLFVTPSPSPLHQRISRRLQRHLEDHVEERSMGEVFNAPIDLILSNHDVFVPDLVVVLEPEHVTNRGIEGAPLLIVEILSPSTRKQDCGVKARRYAELGVEHYWIVDPDACSVECHRLDPGSGSFLKVTEASEDAVLMHPDWDGLEIELKGLWAATP